MFKIKPKAVKGLIGRHYTGEKAAQYERRSKTERWKFEHETLMDMLARLPAEERAQIADIPVGTNRFFEELENDVSVKTVYGMDYSVDMLMQSLEKPSDKYLYARHDIVASAPAITADTVICFRFLNLFPFPDIEMILRNLARTARVNLIFTVRLLEDPQEHGMVLEDKIHLHSTERFSELLGNCGLEVKEARGFDDSKQGDYFVMHTVKAKT